LRISILVNANTFRDLAQFVPANSNKLKRAATDSYHRLPISKLIYIIYIYTHTHTHTHIYIYIYIHTITSIFIADCTCSHKYTLLAQETIRSNRFHCKHD